MSGSGVLREKKQESVQFWLAIGAISLIFHALLIIGIKRWATIAVVDESEPIAVELVEPAGDSASAGEPIVQAAAMKPEIKPEAKPEVKPEPEPEIKSEVKPEPIVQPEVKKVEPAIVPKAETKPSKPRKPADSPKKNPTMPQPIKKNPIEPNKQEPIKSDDPLPSGAAAGSNLTTSLAPPVLRSTPGEIGGKGTAKIKLNFPLTIAFPATFVLKPGEVIRIKLSFVVVGNDIQSPEVKELIPKLTGREKDALLDFVYELLSKISVESIVIDNNAVIKPDTDWETTIELRL